MLASYDWRVRHAGLMAIAAIGEGTGKVCVHPSTIMRLTDTTQSLGHAERTWEDR